MCYGEEEERSARRVGWESFLWSAQQIICDFLQRATSSNSLNWLEFASNGKNLRCTSFPSFLVSRLKYWYRWKSRIEGSHFLWRDVSSKCQGMARPTWPEREKRQEGTLRQTPGVSCSATSSTTHPHYQGKVCHSTYRENAWPISISFFSFSFFRGRHWSRLNQLTFHRGQSRSGAWASGTLHRI